MQHGWPARVAEGHVVEADLDRTAGQLDPVRAWVGDVGRGVQDAEHATPTETAFCASFRTSVPTCTGPTNSAMRNRNANNSPSVMLPAMPSRTPRTTTPPW